MGRKKQLSYNDMAKAIQEMQERQVRERERMATVMAVSLLNSGAASVLGDCSDADLRRIVAYMAEDIDRYMDRLNEEKKARKEAHKAKAEPQDAPLAEAGPQVQGVPSWT